MQWSKGVGWGVRTKKSEIIKKKHRTPNPLPGKQRLSSEPPPLSPEYFFSGSVDPHIKLENCSQLSISSRLSNLMINTFLTNHCTLVVHLRDCSRTKKTGCVSKNFTSPGGRKKSLPGKLCQCDRDLCNVDFTYGRENRAVVSARFRVSDPLPTPAGSKGIPLLPNDLIFFFMFMNVFLLIWNFPSNQCLLIFS